MKTVSGSVVRKTELLQWGHAHFVEKEARIFVNGRSDSLIVKRPAVEAPNGANILPYFFHDRAWYIVLVAQFRHAVETVTWEAPGGVVDHGDVPESMATELYQEAGIKVNPANIEVVFEEYLLPSLTSAFGWGGLVEINRNDLPPGRIYGEPREGEFTHLIVKPLIEIIEMRKNREIIFDLWTSRLINEVANRVGAPV